MFASLRLAAALVAAAGLAAAPVAHAESRLFECHVELPASEGSWIELTASDAGGIHHVRVVIALHSGVEYYDVTPMPNDDALVRYQFQRYDEGSNSNVVAEEGRFWIKNGSICEEPPCLSRSLDRDQTQSFYDAYLVAFEARSSCNAAFQRP